MSKTIEIPLPYTLNSTELVAYAKEAAEYSHELALLEAELTDTRKRLQARIAHLETEGGRLQSAIRAGHEIRSVECVVTFDEPKKGKKTIRRNDTLQTVAVEPMTEDDRQMTIEEVTAPVQ